MSDLLVWLYLVTGGATRASTLRFREDGSVPPHVIQWRHVAGDRAGQSAGETDLMGRDVFPLTALTFAG